MYLFIERMVTMRPIYSETMIDRFSSPLASERVSPSLEYLQEQQELNKKHIVMDYLSAYWNEYSLVPTAEHIQDHFYKIDLDLSMIENEINRF